MTSNTYSPKIALIVNPRSRANGGWNQLVASTKRFLFEAHFGAVGHTTSKKISSIFIGNNTYTFDGFNIGARESITEGKLFIAILNSMHTLDLVRLFIKAIAKTALNDTSLNVVGLQECTIESKKNTLLVAYDGEVKLMISPLRYTVLPKVLKVIVPLV